MAKLTKSQIKNEIKKCGRDPVYFIKNYCKVSHPEKGLIPFKTFDYQDELLKTFNERRYTVILKARQLGISTIVAGYVSWLLMFRREKSVVVIATKFDVAANLVKKVKSMINHLPSWVRISEISINNQTSFQLANGSWIKASSTSGDAGRSEALSLLVIDEAAHIENLDEIWTAAAPTLSAGGRCIALSSPYGAQGWFYETYVKAENGENDFFPVNLPWSVHPERDQDWFDEISRNMSERDVAQEHLCFAAGTKIATDEGFRNIEELNLGDSVLTHKGRFRKVVAKRSRESDNVYSVKTFHNRLETKVTGEHPILDEKGNWVPIQDISLDSVVCYFPKKIDVSNLFSREHKISYNENKDYFTTKILEKKLVDPSTVYNIEVEEDSSFVTEHFVAHNCSFNASGETVITPQDLEYVRENLKEPLYKEGRNREIWIWEPYRPTSQYIIAADVARGDSEDFSTFQIVNVNSMEQVGEFQGKMTPDMFADLLNQYGRDYGNALLVVENNTYGYHTLDKLQKLEYPNLYFSLKSSHEYVDQLEASYNDSAVPGFINSMKSRPLIVGKFEEFVRNRILKINSSRIVGELNSFVWKNGKPIAQAKKNDDLVLAMCIACWVKENAIDTFARDTEYNKSMVTSVFSSGKTLHTKIPGQIGYDARRDTLKKEINQTYEHVQFPWLFRG